MKTTKKQTGYQLLPLMLLLGAVTAANYSLFVEEAMRFAVSWAYCVFVCLRGLRGQTTQECGYYTAYW